MADRPEPTSTWPIRRERRQLAHGTRVGNDAAGAGDAEAPMGSTVDIGLPGHGLSKNRCVGDGGRIGEIGLRASAWLGTDPDRRTLRIGAAVGIADQRNHIHLAGNLPIGLVRGGARSGHGRHGQCGRQRDPGGELRGEPQCTRHRNFQRPTHLDVGKRAGGTPQRIHATALRTHLRWSIGTRLRA